MSTVNARAGEHFAAIDGLRGLACLAVVVCHCYVHCGRYQWPIVGFAGKPIVLSRALYYGNGGVELFFVVSGFCLAYPFFSRANSESWQRWFLRRAYRILPPYYASALLFWGMLVLLRAYPFSLFGMVSPPAEAIPLKGIVVCLTLLNVYFNPSYWTLVLETRWYLLFPLLLGLLRRAGAGLLVFACILGSATGLWLASISPRFVLLTANVFVQLPIFAAGMIVAGWTAKQRTPLWLIRLSPWGILASVLLLAIAIPSDGHSGPIPRVLPCGLGAFFTLLGALNNPWLSTLARKPALVRVGAFSYSLYLIHEPIVHLAYAMFSQLQLTPAQSFLVYECGVLPFCVGLGYLFYRLIERPLLQHGRHLFKREPAVA